MQPTGRPTPSQTVPPPSRRTRSQRTRPPGPPIPHRIRGPNRDPEPTSGPEPTSDQGNSSEPEATAAPVEAAARPPVAEEHPAGIGAVIDPGPLKIVTLEDIEMAARQKQADADLSALIAPVKSDPAKPDYGEHDG